MQAGSEDAAAGALGPGTGAGPAGSAGEEDWTQKYPELANSQPPERSPSSSSSFIPAAVPNISLEDTVAVVKEKMWYLGDAALKSVAEVLYGFGISPTVLGYSEEELMEDDEYAMGAYPPPEQKDEVVSKSSFAMRSEEKLQRRKADEGGPASPVDEAEDGGIQFLAPEDGGWRNVEEEVVMEFGEDKKDK